jgi:hypothetical protein
VRVSTHQQRPESPQVPQLPAFFLVLFEVLFEDQWQIKTFDGRPKRLL